MTELTLLQQQLPQNQANILSSMFSNININNSIPKEEIKVDKLKILGININKDNKNIEKIDKKKYFNFLNPSNNQQGGVLPSYNTVNNNEYERIINNNLGSDETKQFKLLIKDLINGNLDKNDYIKNIKNLDNPKNNVLFRNIIRRYIDSLEGKPLLEFKDILVIPKPDKILIFKNLFDLFDLSLKTNVLTNPILLYKQYGGNKIDISVLIEFFNNRPINILLNYIFNLVMNYFDTNNEILLKLLLNKPELNVNEYYLYYILYVFIQYIDDTIDEKSYNIVLDDKMKKYRNNIRILYENNKELLRQLIKVYEVIDKRIKNYYILDNILFTGLKNYTYETV